MRRLARFLSFSALLVLPLSALLAQAQESTQCDQARDPVRCAARQQAQTACQDKQGRVRQQCLLAHLPAPDCSQVEDTQRCEARQQVRRQCHDKTGRELRACLNKHGLH